MDKGLLFRRTAAAFNKAMLPVLCSAPGRRLLGGSMAVVTYRGRKSGREVSFPVNYRRDGAGGDIVIGVMAPDAKTWWRNFTGDGGPLTLRIGSVEHDGQASVERGADGSVAVRVRLA